MALKQVTLSEHQERLRRAQRFLEAHLDEPLDPRAVAKAAHYSLHHFHRLFRAHFGESVMQHLRRLRIERAARQLRGTERSILEIGLTAGYGSPEAFLRAFREHFGVLPSELRAQPALRVQGWVAQPPGRPLAPIEVRGFDALPVAFRRHVGGYATIGPFWQSVRSWAEEQGWLDGRARLYGLCHDDPDVTAEAQLRFDAAVDAGPAVSSLPELERTLVPAGTYAVGLHVGPYDRLHETYLDVIGRWLPTSGYDLVAEPVVEHYLDDPSVTPPERLRTEVRVRIAEAD